MLNRSELDLGQMMFEKDQRYTKKLLERKQEVTSAYQRFINKQLAFGISLMHLKGIDVYKREFVCKSITIGFFRVPKFRLVFLEQVSKNNELEVDQHLVDLGAPSL